MSPTIRTEIEMRNADNSNLPALRSANPRLWSGWSGCQKFISFSSHTAGFSFVGLHRSETVEDAGQTLSVGDVRPVACTYNPEDPNHRVGIIITANFNKAMDI